MASSSKPSKHAPYSKKVLIPLWIIQLGLSVFLFITSTLIISSDATDTLSRNRAARIALEAVELITSFILTALLIFVIAKFIKFELTTRLFKSQSIAVVLLWMLLTLTYFGSRDFLDGLFPAAAMLVSIWLSIYVFKVRQRLKRGEVGEMKRPVLGSVERGRDVELDGGRDEVPPVGVKAVRDVKVSLVEGSRPFLGSVATSGEAAGPPEQVREFV